MLSSVRNRSTNVRGVAHFNSCGKEIAVLRSIIVLVFASFLTGGCATIMTGGGHAQQVRLNSNPRGATVYVDGNKIGNAPIVAELTRGDDHLVKMEMEGFPTQTKFIKHGPNFWIVGNVLFGGAIGMVVDLASGSMEGVLNPNDMTFAFKPPQAPQPPYSPFPQSWEKPSKNATYNPPPKSHDQPPTPVQQTRVQQTSVQPASPEQRIKTDY